MKKSILLLATFTALFAISCYAQSAPKKIFSSISGLKENVVVRRDGRSIPYVEAKNDSDIYFMQGFETARDRLWQMDLYRRVARGRVAELFGKSVLEEDRRWRRFGFSEIAEESLKLTEPSLRKALDDYARGVNAYIATLDRKTLPIEFQILQYQPEPWQATDTIVIGKILADGLSTTWWQDLEKIKLQTLSKAKYDSITSKITPSDLILFGSDKGTAGVGSASAANFSISGFEKAIAAAKEVRKSSLQRVGFYEENLAASNNWVISGKRTADGTAILANDPHLQGTAPGIWYLIHLSTPTMRVSGVTFPGVPGVVLGHNESIAWGATNVGPDVQDVYFEEFNENGEYKTPDGWKKPKVRNEEMKFRANPLSPKLDVETLEVVETRNGVIFNETDGKKLALNWTARAPENQEFEAFFSLNRAKNWDQFNASLKTYGGSSQNFVFADTKGNIGWHVAGKVPIRRKGEGDLPYDGTKNDGDWIGSIPYDELPHLYNPKSGFIVTANQRIAGTDYKYQQITRQIAAPWRARRIFELLNSNDKVTMDYVGAIQHDSFNIPLSGFAKEIVKRKAASSETLAILGKWDGNMKADSVGATIADQINTCVGNEIAEDSKPASGWQIRQVILPWAIPNNDKLWLPKKFSNWDEILKSCDAETVAKLEKTTRLGGADRSNWKWGSFRVVSFNHPLAAAPLIGGQFKLSFTNVDGSGQTPNVGTNVSMRFVAKPANWDETRHVIPLGQSGNPQSVHWKDQYDSWQTGKSTVFPFTKAAVDKEAMDVLMFTPN